MTRTEELKEELARLREARNRAVLKYQRSAATVTTLVLLFVIFTTKPEHINPPLVLTAFACGLSVGGYLVSKVTK